jgi:hypothetical protein
MTESKIKVFVLQGDPRDDEGEILAIHQDRESLRPAIIKYLKSKNIDEYESNSEVGGWTSVRKFNQWAKGKTIDELLSIHPHCCTPYITEWFVSYG